MIESQLDLTSKKIAKKKIKKSLIILFIVVGLFVAGTLLMSKNYFKITDLGNGTWRITESLGVSEYLIVGTEKALLIDTGFSYGRGFLKTIRKITKLPLIVVNTHYHPDHSGKNNLFQEIYIDKEDMPKENNEIQKLLDSMRKASPIKGSIYSILMKSPQIKTNYIHVSNGMKFELGSRDVEVINVPGHTPGSIMLLDENTKTVFSGDAVNSGTWLFTNEEQKLDEYTKRIYTLFDTLTTRGYKDIVFSHSQEKFDIEFIKEYADFLDRLDIADTKEDEMKVLSDIIRVGSTNSDKYGKMEIKFYEKQFNVK